MLAWDALGGLDAYRITEIPRRPEPGPAPAQADSDDPGRIQRLAALVAAYHAGAEAKGNGSGADMRAKEASPTSDTAAPAHAPTAARKQEEVLRQLNR